MKKIKMISILVLIFLFAFSILSYGAEYKGAVPEEYKQSPKLEEKVESGELPPVEKRLPDREDIYVVDPVEDIGQYGGTLNTTTLQPESFGNDSLFTAFSNYVKPLTDGSGIVPEVAKKLEPGEDKTVWTLYLRKGLKWSDGVEFNAEDILFWYNDVLLNEELTPIPNQAMRTEDGVAEIEKINDHEIKFIFPNSRPYFPNRLYLWHNLYPKHYLSQFHPAYVDEEKLEEKTEKAGFDHWYQLFEDKNSNWLGQSLNPERPVIGPYKLASKSSERRIYERNPYFWKVDPEGNQLPYIDKIETEVISDKEVGHGKVMSGAVDFSGINTDIRNYPMYREYEDEGNYRTLLWTSGYGNEANYFFNLTHEDTQMREVFQNVKFRKAMSYAIDRNEINETIYFGKAKPRQYTVLPTSKFYESEFEETYIEYRPEKARELLDELGVVDQNNDDWRELPDGSQFNITIEYYPLETPKEPNVELVVDYWREVGIDVNSRVISGELQGQRAPGNMMDSTLWHDGSSVDANFPIDPRHVVPTWPRWEECTFTLWSRWFETSGEEGEEPPAEIKQLRNWWETMLEEPDEEKRIELGKKILKSQSENLWTIGTIGETPWPITVNNNLRNFPEEGRWAWGVQWLSSHDPSQLYFKNDSE